MTTRNTGRISTAALAAWMHTEAGVPAGRAARAAEELASSWNDGDLAYQTAKDILGDHLTDADPRPKLIADDLAAHVGITLED